MLIPVCPAMIVLVNWNPSSRPPSIVSIQSLTMVVQPGLTNSRILPAGGTGRSHDRRLNASVAGIDIHMNRSPPKFVRNDAIRDFLVGFQFGQSGGYDIHGLNPDGVRDISRGEFGSIRGREELVHAIRDRFLGHRSLIWFSRQSIRPACLSVI